MSVIMRKGASFLEDFTKFTKLASLQRFWQHCHATIPPFNDIQTLNQPAGSTLIDTQTPVCLAKSKSPSSPCPVWVAWTPAVAGQRSGLSAATPSGDPSAADAVSSLPAPTPAARWSPAAHPAGTCNRQRGWRPACQGTATPLETVHIRLKQSH